MIDVFADSLIRIADLPSKLPTKPSRSAVQKWITNGVAGRRLEVVKVGGQVFTSEAALRAFFAATTDARNTAAPSRREGGR